MSSVIIFSYKVLVGGSIGGMMFHFRYEFMHAIRSLLEKYVSAAIDENVGSVKGLLDLMRNFHTTALP